MPPPHPHYAAAPCRHRSPAQTLRPTSEVSASRLSLPQDCHRQHGPRRTAPPKLPGGTEIQAITPCPGLRALPVWHRRRFALQQHSLAFILGGLHEVKCAIAAPQERDRKRSQRFHFGADAEERSDQGGPNY